MANEKDRYDRGVSDDPFEGVEFDSSTSRNFWDRLRGTVDRVFSRTVNVAGEMAQRGAIEVEVASLRVRLRTLYSRLGEKVFLMKKAEDRDDPTAEPEVLALFDQIEATHAEIASERARLEKIKEQANRDEYAGA